MEFVTSAKSELSRLLTIIRLIWPVARHDLGDRAAGAGFRANFHDRFRSDFGSCVKVVVGRKSDIKRKEFRARRNSASVGDRPRQQNPAENRQRC